jgi:hypothetical protein
MRKKQADRKKPRRRVLRTSRPTGLIADAKTLKQSAGTKSGLDNRSHRTPKLCCGRLTDGEDVGCRRLGPERRLPLFPPAVARRQQRNVRCAGRARLAEQDRSLSLRRAGSWRAAMARHPTSSSRSLLTGAPTTGAVSIPCTVASRRPVPALTPRRVNAWRTVWRATQRLTRDPCRPANRRPVRAVPCAMRSPARPQQQGSSLEGLGASNARVQLQASQIEANAQHSQSLNRLSTATTVMWPVAVSNAKAAEILLNPVA